MLKQIDSKLKYNFYTATSSFKYPYQLYVFSKFNNILAPNLLCVVDKQF